MTNRFRFLIVILISATACLAQDGLTVQNKGKQKWSAAEAQKIYLSACSAVQWEFGSNRPVAPRVTLVLGATKTRYGFRTKKSGLPNGIVTPSPRESYGWPLWISCHRSRGGR
jgi:hypothetical protein